MKRMNMTIHHGLSGDHLDFFLIPEDREYDGWRIKDDAEIASDHQAFRKHVSTQQYKINAEKHESREDWAQLEIEVDGISMFFWTPDELTEVADVLAQEVLPDIRQIAEDEPNLNRHWFSRLPSIAKTPKWRKDFRKFLARNPAALKDFRTFYGVTP